jgi:hypothetical protein
VTSTAVADRAGVHHSAVRRYLSPARVVETLANGLAADPLFCDLLTNVHLEHEVILDKAR